MKSEYRVVSPTDLRSVIIDILSWFEGSDQETLVIALQGDLGAGKTTFVQELGKHFDIKETITSPTFTIMKQYELTHEKFDLLVHIDAYRIEDEAETGPLHLEEIFQRPRTLVCIEWPEQIPTAIPQTAVQVSIEIGENEVRTVKVDETFEK